MIARRGVKAPAWMLALTLFSCSRQVDTVFVPVSVNFASATSDSTEGEEAAHIYLELSEPGENEVTVQVLVRDGLASGHDECGARDYSAAETQVVFPPGETRVAFSLRMLNDDLAEANETVLLEIGATKGARRSRLSTHTHSIVDDDRELLIDVALDFGAPGDGQQDDTEALQLALERARDMEHAVIYFPPGDYRVTHLDLVPGLTYVGENARLVQAPDQATDAQMLTLEYAGAGDSPLTTFQGLSFHGARDDQGEFSAWQFQSSILLSAYGDPSEAGRLRISGQDLLFEESGGSGVVLGTNTDANLCRIQGREVFTDVVKVSGGNSSLQLQHLEAEGTLGTTGIALTGTIPGHQNSTALFATLEDLDLKTGDLEIDVRDGAVVDISRVRMSSPPFYLRAVRSEVRIRESELQMGLPRFRANRIVAPFDVVIESSRITAREIAEAHESEDEGTRTIVVAQVTWDDMEYGYAEGVEDQLLEALLDQSLSFVNCEFVLGEDLEASDTIFAAGSSPRAVDSSQRLVFEGVSVGSEFDGIFEPECSVCEDSP
jgi:hypothetical protein